MLTLSCFTLGGGYVMVPMMKSRFTDKLGWLPEEDILELTALGQSAPGALVVNSALLVGYRIAGLPGALCSLVATALPPLIILSVVYYIYDIIRSNAYVSAALRGMQAGVAAVIADVVCSLGHNVLKERSAVHICVMVAAFAAGFFLKINVVYLLLAAALIGVAMELWKHRKGARK